MLEDRTSHESNKSNGSLNLSNFLQIIFDSKYLLLIIITIFSTSALIFALSSPNIYTSKSILKPTQLSNNINSSLGAYGGIASLAGINLPESSGEKNIDSAIELLKSLSFFENNILPNINLEDLMAVYSWDYEKNLITYDIKKYLQSDNKWVRKAKFPKSQKPSAQEAYKIFHDDYFSVIENKETGFITLSINHQSPFIAKQWVDLIFSEINNVVREENKQKTIKSTNFLRQQMMLTDFAEVKQALATILQQETEKLMLIEVNEDYIFQLIDPPFVPEIKSKPNRVLICILGFLLGSFLGVLLVLVRYFK